jgi:GntR family transcriptional regulator
LIFHVDPSSGLPLYRQLADQVKLAIARGALVAGDRLPSVRAVSESLSLNPATVQKAWQELERGGIAENRRGLGIFVAGPPGREGRAEARRLVDESAARLAADAAALGLGAEEVVALVRRHMQAHRAERRGE